MPDAPPIPGVGGFIVVAVGASAGGLDAFLQFLQAMPAGCGMAFILVQHLAPAPDGLMAELLARHTAMPVQTAEDGMRVLPGHCYAMPPSRYVTVDRGVLRLSSLPSAQAARLPLDVLLRSLAAQYGARTACVVLSGNGADGSAGLKAVAEQGGLVLVQAPEEAAYDSMPRSAIATGAVDQVLPVADMPAALLLFGQRAAPVTNGATPPHDWLADIIALLRRRTVHDFSLYKRGTLQRRVERRMSLAGIVPDGMERYFGLLQSDAAECEELARNLLINVTSFFRDPNVFAFLEAAVIPDLLHQHPTGLPLRIWVAGCSSGEETYSLAMLLTEQIAALPDIAARGSIELQIFASDVDPEAIAQARAGLYPSAIADRVSAARLERFFHREEQDYRIVPELRRQIVFSVQDVLADPPFSRLDMVSCRNLLIYLQPEAQAKVVSLFDFALREGGVLLLGKAETVGGIEGRFEVLSKAERVYRHIGHRRAGLRTADREGRPPPVGLVPGQPPLRHAALAELGRRMLLEAFAPAAIMINQRFECLYLLGPTDRYVRLAPGHATHDLLSMARPGMRMALRSAIQQAIERRERVVVPGGRAMRDGHAVPFDIDVQPVLGRPQAAGAAEQLLLVSFVDRQAPADRAAGEVPHSLTTIELERELEGVRVELHAVIRDLEVSTEEQKAINEEALSINEEYQSTNEELLTSKEELQSLNEELTALNTQLQEALERQRTTSDDLQNVLYSTDVATLFLDLDLNIRFFTPATRSLFSLIPSDVGRPLADLQSQAIDAGLTADAQAVLRICAPIEREIEKRSGGWFTRRILPYRVHAGGVEGVVITYHDITERKRVKEALRTATRKAELASVAKSRFLATASHDLRQPLQALTLLHGLLIRTETSNAGRRDMLMGRFSEALGSMTVMLDTLLDMNQIDAGVVKANIAPFPVDPLLRELGHTFALQAEARGLQLRVVPCGLTIESDPLLLGQMLRNLLANAIKYTRQGKILMGCRRQVGRLRIEVLDTGVGIPPEELQAIFGEYHQVQTAAQTASPGLGLGLSIVQRLGELLGHRVQVRSTQMRGSVFSIEVPVVDGAEPTPPPEQEGEVAVEAEDAVLHRSGAIVVIDDDAELSDLLQNFLEGEGHRVVFAASGGAALEALAGGAIRPDLVLTDFNLPGGMNGLGLAVQLREMFGQTLPVVVLTGDISATTLRDVALQGCVPLSKPVQLQQLTQVIQDLLPESCAAAPHGRAADHMSDDAAIIFIVDAEPTVHAAIAALLAHYGRRSRAYASGRAFLADFRAAPGQCLLIDGNLADMDGLYLLRRLRAAGQMIPAVIMTAHSDVRMAVAAMHAGASDFIEKPVAGAELLASLQRALDEAVDGSKLSEWQEKAAARLGMLTARQHEIMAMVLEGHPSKNIAADLNISQRTVENHRAAIMHKTGSSSLPALARLALAAAGSGTSTVPLKG
jgi:two-component system CheB/CheR fusion protein